MHQVALCNHQKVSITVFSMQFKKRPIAKALTIVMCGLTLYAVHPQSAIAQKQTSHAAQNARHNYIIPAGPLGPALRNLASSANLLLTFTEVQTNGRTTQGLNGEYNPQDAIANLLLGTGLIAAPLQNGGYILRAAPVAQADASNATVLPEISVQGTHLGGLPPVYAGGQVARGGQLGMLGNRDILDTPFNITSYTAKVIEDQQSRTLADVLANDPSVRATTSAGHGMETFRVRGFDLWMGDMSFNGLYGIAPDGHAATEMYERVEVIRGPSALLSGMAPGGSVGGAVNLVPKRAGNQPLTRITGTYAGDSNFGAHVDVSRRFGDQQHWGVRFNGVHSDGRTGVDGQNKSRDLGALAVDFRGGRFRASLDAYISNDEQKNGNVFMASFASTIPAAPDGNTNIYRGAYNQIENKAVLGKVEYDITDDWTAYFTTGRRLHRYDGFLRGTYITVQPNGNYTGTHRNYRGFSDTNSTELGLRGRFQTGSLEHELVMSASELSLDNGLAYSLAGAPFSSNIYNPSAPTLDGTANISSTSDATLSSFALADTIAFLDKKVLLTLGVREQRVRSNSYNTAGARTSTYDESALTPAVGIVVKPWGNSISLYANYIEGLSQGARVADVTAPNYNQEFAPYKTQQAEVGVKWDSGKFLNTFSLFEINKPSLIRDPVTGRYSDDGEQRNRGIEWATAGELTKGTRLLGGVSYTQAVMTRAANQTLSGKRAFGVPTWAANLGAEFDMASVPGLTFTSRVNYTGKHFLNSTNTQQVSSFTVTDIGARYSLKLNGKDVVVRAAINNAFDRRYWLGGFGDGFAQVGAGRLFLLSASFDF